MKANLKSIGVLALCAVLVLSFAACGLKNLDAPELTEIALSASDSGEHRSYDIKWNAVYDQSVYLAFSVGVQGDSAAWSTNGKTTAEQGKVSFTIPSKASVDGKVVDFGAGDYKVTVQAWYEPSDKVADKYESLAGPEATLEKTVTVIEEK